MNVETGTGSSTKVPVWTSVIVIEGDEGELITSIVNWIVDTSRKVILNLKNTHDKFFPLIIWSVFRCTPSELLFISYSYKTKKTTVIFI